jgi:hypothetical protein
VKIVSRIGLVFCFYLFLAFTLVTHSEAEEFYTYKDPQGNLVISNKTPPPGSTVLKQQDLPRTPGAEVPQPQKGADPQPSGRPESAPEPPKSK